MYALTIAFQANVLFWAQMLNQVALLIADSVEHQRPKAKVFNIFTGERIDFEAITYGGNNWPPTPNDRRLTIFNQGDHQ